MWLDSLLVIILFICVITDVAKRKIYNVIIFPGLLVAFFVQFLLGGWGDLLTSVYGFFCGLAILLIPYLMGGMGAGDVKLLALIGAVKGTTFVFATAIYMALFGAVIALAILFFRRGVITSVQAILMNYWSIRNGWIIPFRWEKDSLSITYPYGVAIAGGALISLYAKGLELLW